MRCQICDTHYKHGFCFVVECCGEEEHIRLEEIGTAMYQCPDCGSIATISLKVDLKIEPVRMLEEGE